MHPRYPCHSDSLKHTAMHSPAKQREEAVAPCNDQCYHKKDPGSSGLHALNSHTGMGQNSIFDIDVRCIYSTVYGTPPKCLPFFVWISICGVRTHFIRTCSWLFFSALPATLVGSPTKPILIPQGTNSLQHDNGKRLRVSYKMMMRSLATFLSPTYSFHTVLTKCVC